ncbi:MAG: carboxypeptidase-like regulatory domain-containing protein, partial [Flavisolibacter sp.]|nr:carboxypeptidase-like regulatory domain-containing protein [Flavisolibacter sp.]
MRNILRFQLLVYLMVVLLTQRSNAQQQYAYSSNKSGNQYNFSSVQDKQALLTVLKELNKSKGVYFLFSEESIGNKMVMPVKNANENVEKILNELLDNTGLTYKKINNNTYVIIKEEEKPKQKKDSKSSLAENSLTDNFSLFVAEPVKGRITSTDGVALSGVSVLVKGTNRGTTTNANGEFTINVNRGETLVISYVGYLNQEVQV